jgi:protein phosphatase 4 regulatory subunit 3
LARILDDPTFSVLNSLIFFNQVEIVQHIQANPQYLKELFSVFTAPDADARMKRNAVLLIQQCCSVAKGLQMNARGGLFNNFLAAGLFQVIIFALKNPEATIRVAGCEILIAVIDHDTMSMRSQIFKSLQEKQKPLTDTLIELFLEEPDLGVRSQLAEVLKILLDPMANAQSMDALNRGNGEYLSKLRGPGFNGPGAEQFIQSFYDESAKKLFAPLEALGNRKSSMIYQELSNNLFY